MNDKHSPVDISVCIANYNGGSLVLDCLASVYSQEGDFTLEVIVHDDRSSDDSLQSIREHFPGARTITSDSNVGFCISNNRMAAVAQGRYLLLLNNDAILRPGSLAALMDFALCTLAQTSGQSCASARGTRGSRARVECLSVAVSPKQKWANGTERQVRPIRRPPWRGRRGPRDRA